MLTVTIIGGLFITWLIVVVLFAPHIPYHIEGDLDATSDHFVDVIEATCLTTLKDGNRVEILTNGSVFYPAMLDAIRAARETVNMECYIFRKGEIGDQFIEALAERGRAGVRVMLVLDAIGSLGAFQRAAAPLRAAGCRVEPYQPIKWFRLSRLNNRTHRELLVVDGRVAFLGGAGVADWWALPSDGKPPWRDMMARLEGPVVSDVQGIAAENWLECCGEILTGSKTYKPRARAGSTPAFAIRSSPADRATVSRVLFQMLIEGATRNVRISTPYFLPDRAFRSAFASTVARGVEVRVLLPGPHTDNGWVRLASRRMYGQLLEAGVRLFEYGPGMTHVKALVVDDLWSAIGTTNIDNRSFEHNDEINLAARDPTVAARIAQDFDADLLQSQEVTLDGWRRRPILEKVVGSVAWILERQQ